MIAALDTLLASPQEWIIFVCSMITAIAFVFLSFYAFRSVNCPIAPSGIINNIVQLGSKRLPFFVMEMAEKCKSSIFFVKLPVANGGLYFVGDPKAARDILLDNETNKPRSFRSEKVSGGPNIFSSTNDAFWHSLRKGEANAFSSREVNRMTRICKEQLCSWIENTLESKIANNESFDPSFEMTRLVFKSIMETAFEYKATDEEFLSFQHDTELATIEFLLKEFSNPLRSIFGSFLSERREAFRASARIQAFALKVLRAYHTNPNKSSNNTLIKLIDNNPALKTESDKVPELITFIVAGHDTTAYQLSSTLILLATHQKIARKLRTELSKFDGTSWTKCDYLHYVIKEASRLVPVSAFGGNRTTGREFTFGKIIIPKNVRVILSCILVHHDSSVFPNPSEFEPERWENATKEMNDAHILFSLGKRNCIGQSLAKAELQTCIPALMAKYKFDVVEEGRKTFFLTLKYEGTRLRASKIQ